MSETNVSRRSFVSAAAASTIAWGANDRISLGLIGAGGRGGALMKALEKNKDLNFAITGVCDVYRPNREQAVERAAQTYGVTPRATTDYEELLSWKDIDAVLIAAPDYCHSIMLKKAVEAGKDAYCEKPMGVVFDDAKAAYMAVKQSGRVVQIGTQRRSDPACMAAARLVQSGILGKVTRVDVSMNFQQPRWRRNDNEKVNPADVDWNKFMMGRPARPFDARLLREWQLFSYNTNGIAGLWMCHFIDMVPWFLEDLYPSAVVSAGGVYLWKDGRETSDVFHSLLEYPKGFLVSFAMSLTTNAGTRNQWLGTRGTLDMDKYLISGEGSSMPDKIDKPIEFKPEPGQPDPTIAHVKNFLECLRSRQTPHADIQAGFSHAVACCMSARALDTGRRIRFDRERLELV
jgi:predicted dehydrogenase